MVNATPVVQTVLPVMRLNASVMVATLRLEGYEDMAREGSIRSITGLTCDVICLSSKIASSTMAIRGYILTRCLQGHLYEKRFWILDYIVVDATEGSDVGGTPL